MKTEQMQGTNLVSVIFLDEFKRSHMRNHGIYAIVKLKQALRIVFPIQFNKTYLFFNVFWKKS